MNASKRIRWGILGTANIAARRVIPAIRQSRNGEVVAVASRNKEKAQAYAQEHAIPKSYGSYEALLSDPQLDAIYNPLPNNLHAEWSIRCAEVGRPTLCEKPLASSAQEAQIMVDRFREQKVPFAEAFMYRFHPRTERVQQLLREEVIGDLHLINAMFTFAIRKRQDIRLQLSTAGGALWDIGAYCVNVMRLMTGEEPIAAHAFGYFGPQTGVDETLVGLLQFPNGILGNFGCGLRSERTHGYRLLGSEGCIQVDNGLGPEHAATTKIVIVRGGREERILIPPANEYQLMVEDFADALLENRPPRFSGEDGVANMVVLDRLIASARA